MAINQIECFAHEHQGSLYRRFSAAFVTSSGHIRDSGYEAERLELFASDYNAFTRRLHPEVEVWACHNRKGALDTTREARDLPLSAA